MNKAEIEARIAALEEKVPELLAKLDAEKAAKVALAAGAQAEMDVLQAKLKAADDEAFRLRSLNGDMEGDLAAFKKLEEAFAEFGMVSSLQLRNLIKQEVQAELGHQEPKGPNVDLTVEGGLTKVVLDMTPRKETV